MLSPEWVSVGIAGVVMVGGAVWTVRTVDSGNKKTISAIETGQAVARVREEQHSVDIREIKDELGKLNSSENMCRLAFEGRISKVEQKTLSLQFEVTECKASHERLK
jgi:hypothetical protein